MTQSQLHAAAELYYIYQHRERMKVFQVVGVLLRLFHDAAGCASSAAPEPCALPIEKHYPLRYKRARPHARVPPRVQLRCSAGAERRARLPRVLHRQFVAFNAALA
ncbi:MAG: hypothetical protein U0802_00655 [Candidatus Binatia bacterium]